MYPDVKQCTTQFTHGHQGDLGYTVNYYQSCEGPALNLPPPDYFFADKRIGDTYTHRPSGGSVQIWYRDAEYNWTPAAHGQEHPYLSPPAPPGKTARYVLNVREDGFATWVQKATVNGYKAKKARENVRASEIYISGLLAGEGAGGQPAGSQTASGWRFW